MKGISAVIATILLLLITVAIIGLAFGFFGRITSTTSTATENQTTEQVNKLNKQISIESASTTAVWIKNAGTSTINGATELTVYINGVSRNPCVPALLSMTPLNVSKCSWTGAACVSGDIIKVASPANTVQTVC